MQPGPPARLYATAVPLAMNSCKEDRCVGMAAASVVSRPLGSPLSPLLGDAVRGDSSDRWESGHAPCEQVARYVRSKTYRAFLCAWPLPAS
jgi:hypothetical protein